MTNLTNMTSADLARTYNELTGKNIKPTSYSKTKFIEMIKAEQPAEETHDLPVLTDLLVNPENFDADKDDFFTLSEMAAELGIKAKAARAKIRRRTVDDKEYTKYFFPRRKGIIAQVRAALA